jgi:hypothetical protein
LSRWFGGWRGCRMEGFVKGVKRVRGVRVKRVRRKVVE